MSHPSTPPPPPTLPTPSTPTPSFLVIGAAGRTGVAIIRAAAQHPARPAVHAFARTPSKLDAGDAARCTSVQAGDATVATDIENALLATGATVIVVSVGVPNSTAVSDVRHRAGQALATVLAGGACLSHVRVVVVSCLGASGTPLDLGYGVGTLTAWALRHLLADHTRQEDALRPLGARRVWIVRPVGLGDGKGGGKGVQEFKGRAPSLMVQRADLAQWLVQKVVEGEAWTGADVWVAGCGAEESMFSYFKREVLNGDGK